LEGENMSETALGVISADQRAAVLNTVIAEYARDGWTITSVFAGQAIAQRKDPLGGTGFWISLVFWVATILLSLITAGLFLIVTGIMYLNRRTETVVITVDEHGSVQIR
jgi:hypothetical protein